MEKSDESGSWQESTTPLADEAERWLCKQRCIGRVPYDQCRTIPDIPQRGGWVSSLLFVTGVVSMIIIFWATAIWVAVQFG